MAEYQVEFEKLAHAILLYNPPYDDIFCHSLFWDFERRFVQSLPCTGLRLW
jgi:hypothetical protein